MFLMGNLSSEHGTLLDRIYINSMQTSTIMYLTEEYKLLLYHLGPKKDNLESVNGFRPISLLITSMQIITKLLGNRL